MVDDDPEPMASMGQALEATRHAIQHYVQACREIQRLPHPALASRMMALNARRLEAMEADLQRRIRPSATADALYTNLGVVHAGLISLADASGRLWQVYRDSLALSPPAEGWFMEEALEPSAGLLQGKAAATEGADSTG